MAIPAYVGLQGSGKSYNVVEHQVLEAAKIGRTIFTNIPLNLDLFSEHFPDCKIVIFTIEEIKANNMWFQNVLEKGSLCIIDECWRLWPSGLKSTGMIDDHKEFLAMHRHWIGSNGAITQPVIVTQDLSQVCAHVRTLIDTTYLHLKLDKVGQPNRFSCFVYRGAVTGEKPSKSQLIREQLAKPYKKEVYQYYQSQTQSQTNKHGDERSNDKRANVFGDFKLKIYGGLFLACIIFIAVFARSSFSMYSGKENKSEVVPAVSSSQSSVPDSVNSGGVSVPSSTDSIKEKSLADTLLDDFSHYYISWNNGHFPTIDYKITFKSGDKVLTLTPSELINLEFEIKYLSDCAILLTSPTQKRLVVCDHPIVEVGSPAAAITNI